MAKRIVSLCLAALLLLTLAVPAAAEEGEKPQQAALKISTVSQFLTFAEKCRLDSYSAGLVVSLEKDLDLSNAEFESIPIFCGTFLGNNHTIKGLKLEKDGSVQGLFRYLTKTAVVERLTVQGEVAPEGSRSAVGGIAGENAGTIRNCSFIGAVSGGESVGGITGRTLSPALSKTAAAPARSTETILWAALPAKILVSSGAVRTRHRSIPPPSRITCPFPISPLTP